MDAIYHRKNRTRDYAVNIYESDGTTAVVLLAGDVVRYKVYRPDTTPALDLSSEDISPEGSTITFDVGTNDALVKIAGPDTADMLPGAYDGELIVERDDKVYHVESSVFFLHPSAGGEFSSEQSSSSS